MAISHETGNQVLEAHTHSNLGLSHLALRHCDKALEHFSAALAIHCEHDEDWLAEAAALADIGNAHLVGLTDAEAALPWLLQSVAVFDGGWEESSAERRLMVAPVSSAVRLIQQAYFQLGTHAAALEFAEYAHCRVHQMVLTKQLVYHAALTDDADTNIAACAKPHEFSSLQAFAVQQQAAVVVFSEIEAGLLVWVLSSAGVLTARQLAVSAEERTVLQRVVNAVQTVSETATDAAAAVDERNIEADREEEQGENFRAALAIVVAGAAAAVCCCED